MKDPFGRGLIASVAGAVAINITEFILDLLNISETTLWRAGGIFFLTEEAVATPLGIFIGVITHAFVAIVVGLFISYFMLYTGTNYAVIKGIIISLFALFITLGIIFPLRGLAPEIHSFPNDVLAAFIDHTVFGIIVGYTVKHLQEKRHKPA